MKPAIHSNVVINRMPHPVAGLLLSSLRLLPSGS
jgi:hypothetical protein